MSAAEPLSASLREAHYLNQTGRTDLTPAQRRRVRHKENEALRPHARVGRLRRRYDKQDVRKVKGAGIQFARLVREQIASSRFAPKPNSQRQQRIRRRQGR